MKRSGGHRIPGLNCCGQGRMCYRWSKRYCWGGRGGDAMCFLGTQKSPSVFLPKKSVRENLAFFAKGVDFQVGRARELFPASPFCVVGFFLAPLEFTEGTCYSREDLGFPRAVRNGSDLPDCVQLSPLQEHRWLYAFGRECGW